MMRAGTKKHPERTGCFFVCKSYLGSELYILYDVSNDFVVAFKCVECSCTVHTRTYRDLSTDDHIFLEAVEVVLATTYRCVNEHASCVLE